MNKKKESNTLLALFTKIGAKALSVILKLAKAAKGLKVALAVATFASYAVLFNWKFAVLIIVAISWHEYGHVTAMRHIGIPTKGFYLIPFVGGAAIAEGSYKTYNENMFVSIMGPIFGLILAAATYVAYYVTKMPLLAAASSWMALVNIFNMLPVMPLDGGQMLKSIVVSIGNKTGKIATAISVVIGGVVAFKLHFGILWIVAILALVDMIVMFKTPTEQQLANMPKLMPKPVIIKSIITYGVVLGSLFGIMILGRHVEGASLALQFLK